MSETKASDLVERLRHFRTAEHQDAVKEIERLRAQLAAAEAAICRSMEILRGVRAAINGADK